MNCEILAPAGSKEQLEAAVRSGANAVYIGVKGFNARNNAQNFENDNLKEVVEFCHIRGVRVYAALNIIVFDYEMDKAKESLKATAQSGVDGMIVQDMGIAKLIKECCPDMPLHVSTQGAVHNSLGVEFAYQNGFSRCILARELSFDEIKSICDKKSDNIEVEAFVHGAICVSASGNCLLSACIGGRSGNRGVCAQPCRLNFKHNDREFALSLKDMSYIENAREIANLGVSSLKIEGRMKRAEYVASAVNELSHSLFGETVNMEILEKVFSRSGFTKGYLDGKRNSKMFGIRTKDDVIASAEVQNSLHELYKREKQSVAVTMNLTLEENTPATLEMSDGNYTVYSKGIIPFIADKSPTDENSAIVFLSKMGGTPYYLDKLTVTNKNGLMISPSSLKAMRRECEGKLSALRGTITPYHYIECEETSASKEKSFPTKIIIRANDVEQIGHFGGAYECILPLDKIGENSKAIGVKIAEIPVLLYEGDIAYTEELIAKAKAYGVDTLYCENVGAIQLAKKHSMNIMGGFNLNIANTKALEFYHDIGVEKVILSVEVNNFAIEKLGGKIERGAVVYGKLPLMRLRSCPARNENGCGNCDGKQMLTDRLGKTFPLVCSNKKFSSLLNSVPLYIGDKPLYGTDFSLVYFTNETPDECKNVLNLISSESYPDFERTRGLYYR